MPRKAISMRPEAFDVARTLGALVKARRHELSMTADMLAARASVSPRTVSLIERGDPNVSLGNVLNVAATVGVPLFGSTSKETTALVADAARARVSTVHRVRSSGRAKPIGDADVDF